MNPLMVPNEPFLSDPVVHFPESFGRSLLHHNLKLVNYRAIISMTLIMVNGPRKIQQFAGPTQTYLIRPLKMINPDALLGGP